MTTKIAAWSSGLNRAEVEREIRDLLSKEGTLGTSMLDLDKKYPGLLAPLVAVASASVSTPMSDLLGDTLTEAGKAKGRSGASVKGGTVPDGLPSAQESYLRPNGDKYYPRKWGEHVDVEVLRKARATNHFILLYGAPGCGKTALVEAAFGMELETVLGSGDTEVSDLVGGYVATPGGNFEWVDGKLLIAAQNGTPLLIDEIGLIDPKVLSIVYGLMDGRREYTVTANPDRGTVKAKDGFYVIAATNPNAPGVRLSEALLSRFTLHAEMTTDWNLARKLGVLRDVVTVGMNLSKKQADGSVSWAPQFRELLAFRDVSRDFGQPFAIANLIASAPEIDRATVEDVCTKVFGVATPPATI